MHITQKKYKENFNFNKDGHSDQDRTASAF